MLDAWSGKEVDVESDLRPDCRYIQARAAQGFVNWVRHLDFLLSAMKNHWGFFQQRNVFYLKNVTGCCGENGLWEAKR